MFELVYDIQLNAWISLNLNLKTERAISLEQLKRRGFYPYAYNFVYGKRIDTSQCSYCGKFVLMRDMTRDHVWPKSLDGKITTTACYTCNTKKKDLKPIEFAILWSENGKAFGE